MISVKSQVHRALSFRQKFSPLQQKFKSIIPIVLDQRITTLPDELNN